MIIPWETLTPGEGIFVGFMFGMIFGVFLSKLLDTRRP